MQTADNEYGVRATARELNVSEITVRRLIAQRLIGHYRRGSGRGLIVVTRRDIEDYRQARYVAPVAA